jgi:hypothetical protein
LDAWCRFGLIAHQGDEQIGDAVRAHLAETSETIAIDSFEEQDA